MATNQGLQLLSKSPAVTERQRRAILMMAQCAVFGLMLGIVGRAAWDHGIIASFALALRDIGVAVWSMFHDLADAGQDLAQFVSHQRSLLN